MRELNIESQEQYKRIDKLCREMYSSKEGVSTYIQDMENTFYDVRCGVNDWDKVYKELKHVRWMRNQLAHDVSIDTDFCEQSDIEWVKWFYNCIIECNDPLAIVYNNKKQLASKKSVIDKKNIAYNNLQEKNTNLYGKV